jgi:hypothetical protein
MLSMSIRMWSGPDISSCIIFDSPSDSVVDTVLAVMEHHDGVGKAGVRKLQVEHPHQLAKELALGREEARMELESSGNVTQAVLAFMMDEQAQTSLGRKVSDEDCDNVIKKHNDNNLKNFNLNTRPTLEDKRYEVEKVVTIRKEIEETEFGQQDHVWEPEQNLGCAKKIKEFVTVVTEDDVPERTESARESDKGIMMRERTPCVICGVRVRHLAVHTKKVHTVSSLDIFPCDHCCEWFSTREDVDSHISFHNVEKNHNRQYCKLCPRNYEALNFSKEFKSGAFGQQILNQHLLMHVIGFKCKKCNKGLFDSMGKLKAHIRKHQTNQKKCDNCNKIYCSQPRLDNHVIRDHKKELNFQCDLCDKKFASNFAVGEHKKVVHVDKMSFVCDECGSGFKLAYVMKRHIQTSHEKLRPFLCTWNSCGNKFASKGEIRLHLMCHTGIKPHKCNVCESSFRRNSHLDKHKKLHTGERPYVCNFCEKGFIQKINMKLHKCDIK